MAKVKAGKQTKVSSKKKAKPVKKAASRTRKPALKPKASSKSVKTVKLAAVRRAVPKRHTVKILMPAQTRETGPSSASLPQSAAYADLPFSYNETKLVLLVRDPSWAYSYWDFSAHTWEWIQSFCRRDRGARPKLRIHNLDAGHFFDVDVTLEAKNWYLDLGLPDTAFEAELGLLDSQGRFHTIVKSNRVRTPRNKPSETTDPGWEALEFDEIYKLSGGGKTGHGSELFSQFKRP